MATTQALTERQLKWLHRQLLKKGAEINEQLVALLADPTIDLRSLPIFSQPGERPAERLRRFLNLIDARLHAIRDGSYGRCEECGEPLSFVALEQMPWADRCQACAEKDSAQ